MKYMLGFTLKDTIFDPEQEEYREVTFNSEKELEDFLKWEVIAYKERGYEHVSIDVYDEADEYIDSYC